MNLFKTLLQILLHDEINIFTYIWNQQWFPCRLHKNNIISI